jgi:DNA-directed RNA polymerase specialized sigma24 family protein
MSEYGQICERIDALYPAGDREELFAAVHQLAMRRLRGDKDAAQDATLRVLSGLDTYRAQCAFSRWVNSLITCALIQDRRERNDQGRHVVPMEAYRRTGEECESEQDTSDRLSFEAQTEDDLFWNDYFRPIERVEELQPTIVDPFIAQVASAILEGHRLVDIAPMLNISLASLKGRLKRFRQKLRKTRDRISRGEVGMEYKKVGKSRCTVTPFSVGSGKHNKQDWNKSASDESPLSLSERRYRLAS